LTQRAHRPGRSGEQREADAREPPPLHSRSRRRRVVSHRVVDVAPTLRALRRLEEERGAQAIRHVGAVDGPVVQPRARLHHAACRRRAALPRRAGAHPVASPRPGDEPAPSRRLDLPAIEASLRRVQQEFARINEQVRPPRDPLADDVVNNMVAGYELVDHLAAREIDPFAMGNLKYLLELNTIVLCGTDPVRREEYTRHRQTTEERFYDAQHGGIQGLVEWYE